MQELSETLISPCPLRPLRFDFPLPMRKSCLGLMTIICHNDINLSPTTNNLVTVQYDLCQT